MPEYRITKTTRNMMMTVAFLFDSIQAGLDFIPIVGWILSSFVGIIGFLTILFWMKTKGVSILIGGNIKKKLMLILGVNLSETTLSFLPTLMFFVYRMYLLTNEEDKLAYESKLKKMNVAKKLLLTA
ncbi:hypothetical protein ACFLY7_00160 [Patescibacteria group bacterium]